MGITRPVVLRCFDKCSVLKGNLCSERAQRATRLTWLPAQRVQVMSLDAQFLAFSRTHASAYELEIRLLAVRKKVVRKTLEVAAAFHTNPAPGVLDWGLATTEGSAYIKVHALHWCAACLRGTLQPKRATQTAIASSADAAREPAIGRTSSPPLALLVCFRLCIRMNQTEPEPDALDSEPHDSCEGLRLGRLGGGGRARLRRAGRMST